jgi:biopolymer transport protein TolQ
MLFPLASTNAFTAAYCQSDLFGKAIMGALFALSIICWIVLTCKFKQIRKVKDSSSRFYQFIHKNRDNLLTLEPSQGKSLNPFLQIYFSLKEKTVETLNKKTFFLKQNQKNTDSPYLTVNDLDILEQHVFTTISSQSKQLENHLFILSTIVTLAPFLGLLGTVWGILVTFAELQTGASAGSNSTILGGLSTALVTTVLGLVIAIPALISYNYLKNNVKSFSSDMEDFLYSMLSTLELQYRKVEVSDEN